MKITVIFTGAVQQQLKRKQVIFDLSAGARFGDLMAEIAARFGRLMSERIWDQRSASFKSGISVIGSDRMLIDPHTSLEAGETVTIVQSVAGG